MDKMRQTIKSILDGQPVSREMLTHVPDLNSEKVMGRILEILKDVYNQKMPFNRYLGIDVIDLTLERAIINITSREELQGNYMQKILHGGVISSVIDLSGGIIAQAHAIRQMKDVSVGELILRFGKMSTLNIRVDYLRPGAGKDFRCVSKVIRAGNKVAVAQMELFNDKDELISMGTGSYLIG